MNQFNKFLPSIIFITFLLIFWEIYVLAGFISINLLPTPRSVALALLKNWSIILHHATQTLTEALIGFLIAAFLGSGIAIALDMSPALRRILYPILISSQTVPFVALAPLFLVWFGFGIISKILMVVLFCFFPIAIASFNGLKRFDREIFKLLKSMNASSWQILKFVKIPNALPSFFAGAKIASVYAVTGAIIGEFVGAENGLGIYMRLMANSRATANLFAAILMTIILSIILFLLVNLIEKISTPWNKNH